MVLDYYFIINNYPTQCYCMTIVIYEHKNNQTHTNAILVGYNVKSNTFVN